MEKLYCNTCEKYTEHKENICSVCQSVYDPKKKRYIICGVSNHPKVIAAKEKILEETPDAIIIPEKTAFENKTVYPVLSENKVYYLQNINFGNFQEYENIKYNHLSKKEREAIIEPVRSTPKIRRNDLCSCGSGKKYKNCCINK